MSFLFGSKAQRTFKKIQDLAAGDMVDQAAVMVEEELETLLEDHDIAAKLVPFLMDIGHPDLGGRIGERIIKTHSDLRMSVTRLLEEKQAQFPRSIELLRVIWKSRLHQRDFNGLMDILGRTERVTVSRFADSIQSSAQALSGARGRELGQGIERILAWAVISLHRGDPSAAMDILVDAARRCSFPEESLSRLSGWIAARTGGTEMEVNLKRIQVLTAIGDRERAVSELPGLYEAEKDILDRAISLVEKELVPGDKTSKARISLARLMAKAGRVNEACLMLDPLLEGGHESSMLEQAVTGLVIGAQGSARVHLLQARLRLFRGENTQALDSIERAFGCPDVAESPVVDICRSFIKSGIDRDGMVTGKLGEFLVEKGTVDEAVNILSLSVATEPEWVLEKLQLLLKRDRTSAAVLTLLAVVLLVLNRGGEAAATLKHLAARKDVKSKQDIVSVLSDFDDLMGEHRELRRLRAASGAASGTGEDSARDWLELIISGDKVSESGCLVVFDSGVYKDRAAEILESGFTPDSPGAELVLAAAKIVAGVPGESSEHLSRAMESTELLDRVTHLVASLPFSAVAAMKPEKVFRTLNDSGRGEVVAKILPLLSTGETEKWMDDLASRVSLPDPDETALFRLRYFIEQGKPGTAAAAAKGLEVSGMNIVSLLEGCAAVSSGDLTAATEHLSRAASHEETASLAKAVLGTLSGMDEGNSASAIALARAELKTGNIKGAVETLRGILHDPDVLVFLEEAAAEVPGAHMIHGCLALARLYTGDADGYRAAAGTALEGSSEMASELVEKGAGYSLENHYALGMLFAAEAGISHIEGFQSAELLSAALCTDPSLAGRVAALKSEDETVQMLTALALCDPLAFSAKALPKGVSIPESMIDAAVERWEAQNALDALEQLEELSGSAGYAERVHRIRKILAAGGRDRSKELLSDAMDRGEWRADLLSLCSNREVAGESIEKLFPDGVEGVSEDEIEAAGDMLVRCGAREALYDFAVKLLEAGTESCSAAAGKTVDIYVPTAGEEGSLTVEQVVDLLLLAGRTSDAFPLARGDSGLLAKVRQKVALLDRESSTPESILRSNRPGEMPPDAPAMARGEALWMAGQRRAACGVWKKGYEETSDPALLQRLMEGFHSMGRELDSAATARLLAEKHPDVLFRSGEPGAKGKKLALISYSIK